MPLLTPGQERKSSRRSVATAVVALLTMLLALLAVLAFSRVSFTLGSWRLSARVVQSGTADYMQYAGVQQGFMHFHYTAPGAAQAADVWYLRLADVIYQVED